MGNTIQGSFGWDNSPLINGMRESEQVVTRGANNIQNKLTGIFKRSPNMRAERAFSGLAQSLATGDIAGGIASISSKMTGLGIVAGVAIGAGVAVFEKFREQIHATREAYRALELEGIRRPLSIVSNLSPEGIGQEIQTRAKLISDLQDKLSVQSGEHNDVFPSGQELLETAKSFASKFRPGGFRDKSEGRERNAEEAALNQKIAENKKLMIEQGNAQMEITNIERGRLLGNEREATIAKIVLDTERQRAALKLSGVTNEAFQRGDEALSQNAELMIKAENDRADIKERSLALEEKMADLTKKGLRPEDQRKVRTDLELKSIDQQITKEKSPQRLRELNLQKTQKENEIRAFAPPSEGENPFQFGTISARNVERQQASEQFMSNFGTLGMSQEERDRKAPPQQNSEVTRAIKEAVKDAMTASMDKYWGAK